MYRYCKIHSVSDLEGHMSNTVDQNVQIEMSKPNKETIDFVRCVCSLSIFGNTEATCVVQEIEKVR